MQRKIKHFFWIILLAPLFFSCLSTTGKTSQTDPLQIRFLNMGYADSILIQFPNNKILLIDAGDKENAIKLQNEIETHGIKKINFLIITHPHKNHFGALLGLTNTVPIKRIFENGDDHWEEGYADLRQEWQKKQIPIQILKTGDQIPVISKETKLEVLSPGKLTDNPNDNSIVLKLTYGKTSFLFTGDIGETIQNKLIESLGPKLKANCVLIPHHGGPFSKVFAEFFDNGTIYVISTGPNRWGIPRAEDLTYLKEPVLRTDKKGDIILKSDGKKIEII